MVASSGVLRKRGDVGVMPKKYNSYIDHGNDIGITCKFLQADECEACPTAKFSNTVGASHCTDCEADIFR